MPVDSSRIDQADIDPRAAALLAALAFARHDHAVLPLTWPIKVNGRMVCSCRKAADCTAPAKHPLGRLVPRGLLDASTDEPTIRKWFANEPAANLGVRTDKLTSCSTSIHVTMATARSPCSSATTTSRRPGGC